MPALFFRYRRIALLLVLSLCQATLRAQISYPVRWSFSQKDVGNNQFDLVFTGKIDKGYHTYSMYLSGEDGPVPTSINYEKGAERLDISKAVEGGNKKTEFDKVWGMNITFFDDTYIITQRVRIKDPAKGAVKLEGYLECMACDDQSCKPPRPFDFSFTLTPTNSVTTPTGAAPTPPPTTTPAGGPPAATTSSPPTDTRHEATQHRTSVPDTAANASVPTATVQTSAALRQAQMHGDTLLQTNATILASVNSPLGNCGTAEVSASMSIWKYMVGGLGGGLLALLMPCLYPMIPLTVSFFTKRSRTRREGLRNALIYAVSIIVIHVVLGASLGVLLGPTGLNWLSTHWLPNLLFFAIFTVFALSFFGYFEITLPASWTNKADAASTRGGVLGIFFMAFTLFLVSFSCTGPIVGTALVAASKSIGSLVAAMLGFGTGLALPFALFAAFPTMLKAMPRSGNWMDDFKVSLGFLELALALKFLSVADYTYKWGVLRYELFLGLWILIFLGLALYFFGWLRFKHHQATARRGAGSIAIGTASAALALYLASGFFINPNTGLYQSKLLTSGLAPPATYNFFLGSGTTHNNDAASRYLSFTKCANNIDCFHDYYEGIAYAQEVNKPVMIDFTGYGCVNCRKTEDQIWVDERVRRHLNDSYVLVSLYVDDPTKLPRPLYNTAGDKMRTVGHQWADFQATNFGSNSQPLYVLMTPDQRIMAHPRAYHDGVESYLSFLECGLQTFQQHKGSLGQR